MTKKCKEIITKLMEDIKFINAQYLAVNCIIIDYLVFEEIKNHISILFNTAGTPSFYGFILSIEKDGIRRDREYALTSEYGKPWRFNL